jgi:hypothetical protein
VMAYELAVLFEWRLLLHRWIVDLGLQVGHGVSQILAELSLSLEKLICPSCGAGPERFLLP